MQNRSSRGVPSSTANIARRAVLYARVSSKEQELGYSIDAQQNLLRRRSSELCLAVKEFLGVETVKKAGRPGFEAMLKYLKLIRIAE